MTSTRASGNPLPRRQAHSHVTARENPHDEARARILWGESPAEVEHWLVGRGLTEEQAEVIIREIGKERAFGIRRSGLRSIRTGVLLLLGGIALGIVIGFLRRIPAVLAGAAWLFTIYGAYKILTGLLRVLTAGHPGR